MTAVEEDFHAAVPNASEPASAPPETAAEHVVRSSPKRTAPSEVLDIADAPEPGSNMSTLNCIGVAGEDEGDGVAPVDAEDVVEALGRVPMVAVEEIDRVSERHLLRVPVCVFVANADVDIRARAVIDHTLETALVEDALNNETGDFVTEDDPVAEADEEPEGHAELEGSGDALSIGETDGVSVDDLVLLNDTEAHEAEAVLDGMETVGADDTEGIDALALKLEAGLNEVACGPVRVGVSVCVFVGALETDTVFDANVAVTETEAVDVLVLEADRVMVAVDLGVGDVDAVDD